jgi:CheY-like chemotaxis protein
MHLTILYVEDSQFVSDAVKETLEGEGWQVESCVDGSVALLLIKSNRRYDVLLLDNELPNVSGWNWHVERASCHTAKERRLSCSLQVSVCGRRF